MRRMYAFHVGAGLSDRRTAAKASLSLVAAVMTPSPAGSYRGLVLFSDFMFAENQL